MHHLNLGNTIFCQSCSFEKFCWLPTFTYLIIPIFALDMQNIMSDNKVKPEVIKLFSWSTEHEIYPVHHFIEISCSVQMSMKEIS